MDQAKQDIIQKLKDFNNVLVTVSRNPSVDQLAACIGLTLLLNKLDKHATAVFSGKIPDTIDFLKPEDTIEKNTDSLRDFIIALDKSKADKLRYKVEDKVVKIFITPYRTSLSQEDLNFSQGDFNIDVVIALGVHEQSDLDDAITAHGRILHDATVVGINNVDGPELGVINWTKRDASSLSELVVELAKSFEEPLLDAQISTALLTGIVAETDRFRNEKTTATTMSMSADLMNAGANQQLVAEELDHEIDVHADEKPKSDNQPTKTEEKPVEAPPKPDDGTLEINHEIDNVKENEQGPLLEEPSSAPEPEDLPTLPEPEKPDEPEPAKPEPTGNESRPMITEAPSLGGRLTANTTPEDHFDDDAVDPAIIDPDVDKSQPLLHHNDVKAPPVTPPQNNLPPSNNQPKTDFPHVDFPKAEPPKAIPVPTPTPHFEPPKSTITPAPKPPAPSTPKPFTPSPVPPAPAPAPPPVPQAPKPEPPRPPMPSPAPLPPRPLEPPKPVEPPKAPEAVQHETLTELEQSVHANKPVASSVDEVEKARQEVMKAISEQPNETLPPVQALNAQPLGAEIHHDDPPVPGGGQLTPPASAPINAPDLPPAASSPADQPLTMPLPSSINVPPPQAAPPTNAPSVLPNSPPPVPPPMMPPQR